MFLKNVSLKQKLFIIFVVLSVIPVLLTALILYNQAKSSMDKMVDDQLKQAISVSDYYFNQKANEALDVAKHYAQYEDLNSAFISRNRELLAEQSKTSVIRIGDLINDVQQSIGQAVQEINKSEAVVGEQEKALADTVKAFNDISGIVSSIANSVKVVSQSSIRLDQNVKDTEKVIENIATIAQETASCTQEVTASTEEQSATIHEINNVARELAELANNLQRSIERFNV